MQWDMLCYSNYQWYFGFNGFFNSGRSLMCCHVDSRSIWLELLYSLSYTRQYWKSEVLALLVRRNAADDVGTPSYRFFGIGGCLSARETLKDDPGGLANLQVWNGMLVSSQRS